MAPERKLRVLLVPESVHWVTGTIAKNIARFNPWIEPTIVSGLAIDEVFTKHPALIGNFDLVHFTCQNVSKQWLKHFRDSLPCVTSHHHVDNWSTFEADAQGDAIMVGSPQWAEDLRNRGVDEFRVFCVPSGVDATLFRPSRENRLAMRQRLGLTEESTAVGFFGKASSNNEDRKGVDIFMSAAFQLNDRIEKLAILLVGPGWSELKNSLTASGVQCIWIPFLREQKDLVPMYQALDFYWVTARVEGGPVTLLEAMSTEVCCLTTAVGIAREIVEDAQNALLLPFNDAEAFVETTALLVSQPEERRRMGQAARQTILQQMHVGITATGVRAVYKKAIENFAQRMNRLAQLNVDRIVDASPGEAARFVDGFDEIPLSGLPVSLRKRIKSLESLVFAEFLLADCEHRRVALEMIFHEWRTNPLSVLPIKILLRRVLPVSWVSRLIRFKQRSRRDPAIVAN